MGMKNKVYSFAKFYDANKIQDAVRALVSAGIPREQIRVLSPNDKDAVKRNNVNPPEMKRSALMWAVLGALAGVFMGGLIFVTTSFLLDYAYKKELALVGGLIFVVVGIAIGVIQSYGNARRTSGDHLIGPDEHGVFVTLIDESQEVQLNKAKDAYDRMDFANA